MRRSLESIERLEATLATMQRLQRFRGHFYNWYDTRDLRPLEPQYVSSVDSGNLAGHLIALANACHDWRTSSLSEQQRFQGVADALDLVRDEACRLRDLHTSQAVSWRRLDDEIGRLASGLSQESAIGAGIEKRLAEIPKDKAIITA